jgi:hypothetical protein
LSAAEALREFTCRLQSVVVVDPGVAAAAVEEAMAAEAAVVRQRPQSQEPSYW